MGLPTLFQQCQPGCGAPHFSQGFKMQIPNHLVRDMKRERNFEKNVRNKEREALCKAVANSLVQQALARKQMDELKAALPGVRVIY